MDAWIKERPDAERRIIVFVSFESRLAPSGGLGAVMKALPNEMARHERCCVLAPYFPQIAPALPVLTTFLLPLRSGPRQVEIREIRDPSGLATYLLSSNGFFSAPVDPYLNPLDPEEPMDPYVNPINPEKLVVDALFFCAAVPSALVALARKGLVPLSDLVLHLQDWETACTAQAIRLHPAIASAACVLTLHNPYDRYLGMIRSPLVGDLVSYLGLAYDNVLAQMIPLADGPLSTVSQNFADELTSDPLHSHVFARHLQHLLASKGVVGIGNGLFGELSFPFALKAGERARQGDFDLIQEEWGQVTAFPLSSQQELAAAYRCLVRRGSVFALTAVYEPFGLAPLEAMSCGLPAVVTQNGGPSESMRQSDQEFGVLVDPTDPDSIARGLLRIVGSQESWQQFHLTDMHRVRSRYTWERTAEGYLDVIEAMLRGPAHVGGVSIPPYFGRPSAEYDIGPAALEGLYFA